MTAKPGQEADAEAFLLECLRLVGKEVGTTRFFVLRIAPGRYAIFDTFASPEAFEAHLNGETRAYVDVRVGELFESYPEIIQCEVLGAK